MAESDKTPHSESTWEQTKVMWIWIIVLSAMGISALIIISIYFSNDKKNWSEILGAELLLAGSSFALAGIVGLLFGVPKTSPPKSTNSTAVRKATIIQNDNLVQVSDWLTKIIVGVGLTKLYSIPTFLKHVSNYFSPAIFSNDSAQGIVLAIMLFYLPLGFFAIYLWTRLFFVRLLKSLVADLQIELQATVSEIDKKRKRDDV